MRTPTWFSDMNEQQQKTIEKWRKRQVYCVAMGNLGGLGVLIGLSAGSVVLFVIGMILFLFALVGVFVGGVFAWQAARSSPS
ncbi:hypothetical protein GC197_12100 [bacterium]|nr:hypothetical protein [bacterium]